MYCKNNDLLAEYEELFCHERQKTVKFNRNEIIDVSFLDRRIVISIFYNAFRCKNINQILKQLENYCSVTDEIRSKLLATNLSNEDLDYLASVTDIQEFKNIYLYIKFTPNGELIIDEDYSRDYIPLLFSYLCDNDYFKGPEFQYTLKFIHYLEEKQLALVNKIAQLREEAHMLPKEEREIKKREQWMIEEEECGIQIIIYQKQKELIRLLSSKKKANKDNKLSLSTD